MNPRNQTMKPLLTASLALVFAAGCSINDSAVRILGARPLDVVDEGGTECETRDEQLLSGSLDIAAQSSYIIQLDMESDLQAINTTSGGQVIADPSRNNFYGRTIFFEYSSTPALTFELEEVPIHFVVEPQSDSAVRLGLISFKAAQVLSSAVLPGDVVELAVGLEIRGQLASGQPIRTNKITYPITIYNSGFAGCPAGTLLRRNGPCGATGGQDGTVPSCCTADPANPTVCAE
jgi:hypothetical protein